MAMTETLGSRSRGRDNAFDVLRLLGATLVLVSHSFALAGVAEPKLGRSSFGVLGVEIFFAISGFLVTASWLSDPRPRAFLAKRGLRILPALIVTVAVSAFLLGPLLTTLAPGGYARAPGTLSYLIDNVVAVVTGGTVRDVAYSLPGVFSGNPMDAVNGSLWTLPVEVRAYALVLALGLVSALTRWLWPLVVAGLAVVFTGTSESNLLLVIFMVGALMYVHRDRIPLRGSLALAALAGWAACVWFAEGAPVVAVSAPYLVLYVAYRAPAFLRRLTSRGDVSYGVYLLAFPVGQTIVQLLGSSDVSPYAVIALSFPITYVLAMLSWRFVEKPALRLKNAAAGRRRERPAQLEPQAEPQPVPAMS
jgi:peptidoglycan/LPS O-acetylase OafA/YrhL